MAKKTDLRISLADIAKLKRMNTAQIYAWLVNFYRIGYEDGLRDGETEFDDAVIMTEEEVRERVGDAAYDVLVSEEKRDNRR